MDSRALAHLTAYRRASFHCRRLALATAAAPKQHDLSLRLLPESIGLRRGFFGFIQLPDFSS
jgi:hypothetical protein